jgi:hypothetical protein
VTVQELAYLPVSRGNTGAPVTADNPLRSRPSRLFAITVLLVVGFTPLPALYFLFLAGMIATYLLLVEVVKRWLMRRLK